MWPTLHRCVVVQGALFAFECLSETLGILFEPYVIRILPFLLKVRLCLGCAPSAHCMHCPYHAPLS